MKLEEINESKLSETEIEEVTNYNKKLVMEKIQEKFGCNKAIAEYLIFQGLIGSFPLSKLEEQIEFLDNEGWL